MDFEGAYYYELNQKFLSVVGLSPYQKCRYIGVLRIFCIMYLLSGSIVQLTAFLTLEYSVHLMLKISSFAILPWVYAYKYYFFCIATEKIQQILELIKSDWKALVSKEEYDIIKEYGVKSRRTTILFAGAIFQSATTFMFYQFLPQILDLFIPLNVSRTRHMALPLNYFVDEETYFYPIVTHLGIVVYIGTVTLVGTEGSYLIFIQHICGMLKIAGYRARNTVDDSLLEIAFGQRQFVIRGRLISAIDLHRRVAKLSDHLNSTFMSHYFFLVGLGILSTSVNLFRLSQALTVTHEVEDIIVSYLFVLSHVAYLFCWNYIGQMVIDHNADIFTELYSTKWYYAPVNSQKEILVLMTCLKSIVFVTGGIFIPSLRGFTTVTNMAMSYFMVIYQSL